MTPSRLLSCLLPIAAAACMQAHAADPVLSPDAPRDRPTTSKSSQRMEAAIAPYVAQAKATYPEAKRRFLAGLPHGQSFFITTRLRDKGGRAEQVFVAVQSISGGTVTGKIWSEINLVEGYRYGDPYAFPETAMVDWLITHPDGREEGNFVGRFLDTYSDK